MRAFPRDWEKITQARAVAHDLAFLVVFLGHGENLAEAEQVRRDHGNAETVPQLRWTIAENAPPLSSFNRLHDLDENASAPAENREMAAQRIALEHLLDLEREPGKPQRMSVWPVASHTRPPSGPGSSAVRRIENAPQAVHIDARADPHHALIAERDLDAVLVRLPVCGRCRAYWRGIRFSGSLRRWRFGRGSAGVTGMNTCVLC
jgi:hypothetical protein